MTLDWFLLLTPVVVLLILLPVLFVGCGTLTGAPSGEPQPDLKLLFAQDLQDHHYPTPGDHKPVVAVDVTWELTRIADPSVVTVLRHIVSKYHPPAPPGGPPPPPPALDPNSMDTGDDVFLNPPQKYKRDFVKCKCSLIVLDGGAPAGAQPASMGFVSGQTHTFRLEPDHGPDEWFEGGRPPFKVVPETADT